MRIAYLANSDDLLHPADRRRFGYFARKNNIIFENFDNSKNYDLLIISIAANFHKILSYKKQFPNTKIIFDYCDDLLSDSKLKQLIRPLYESIKWRSFKNFCNFNNLVVEVLSSSDIVICGYVEQRNNLLKYNKSVEVIPDFVITETLYKKDNFELVNHERVSILWEGLSGGLLRVVKDLFKLFKNLDSKVLLNIVTDPNTYLIGDRFIKIDTKKYLARMSKKYGIEVRFWSWSKTNLNRAIEASDLGIILIPENNATMQNKPENKLVLLSSFSIPVLVSPTPSYKRFINNAGGEKLYGLSTNFEKLNIQDFCSKKSIRAFVGEHLYNYAIKEYSEKKILVKWQNILNKF